MKINLSTKIILTFILIVSLGLRVYKLDSFPPSLSWDEAAFGVNAWMIANYGQDEYGRKYPLYFRSFGDDKHPVHIYLTALSVKLLGLNEFSTRLPAAFFGTVNVFLIFFLGRLIFKNDLIGLFSSFFLAISPYNIHFSRFNHEANFMLFFFMLGLTLFFLFVKGKHYLLPFAFLAFAISFITYHPAKVVVPAFLLFLIAVYLKKLSSWRESGIALIILFLFSMLLISTPQLLGTARISQNTLNKEAIEKTKLFQLTGNELAGRINLVFTQYLWHLTPQYLFIQGDKNPRLSSQTGQFYSIEIIFFILGLIYVISKKTKEGIMLLAWVVLAPLPSALVAEAPHAARAGFMMGSWNLISALGFYFIINIFKNFRSKIVLICIIILVFAVSLFKHLTYYFGEYTQRYAIEWQYGMKQIVAFVKENPQFNQVYMTDKRSQPYIFFLYYLKTPLPNYLNTVLYNNAESKSYNLVSGFDKYYFGGTNVVENKPAQGLLYILTPSEYDGLMYKVLFEVKKIIYYPNNTIAYYILS